MGIKDILNRAQIRFYDFLSKEAKCRYEMEAVDYTGFPDSDDREAFIRQQLKVRGFDLKKPILQYRGMNNSKILFEQFS